MDKHSSEGVGRGKIGAARAVGKELDEALGPKPPRSVGCDYHPWVVAVTLEGLTGQAWDRFADL